MTNQGTRATRTGELDRPRLPVGRPLARHVRHGARADSGYGQVLAAGASYTETVNVRIPDGIQGNFDVIVYADSDAKTDFQVQSNIGYGLYGVQIGAPNELDPYDLVSVASPQPGPRPCAAVRGRGRQDRLGS